MSASICVHAVFSHFERELIEALNDPRMRYLDLFDMSFDHAAHHTNDRESHLAVLRKFDALLGRIWTGIEKSPLASETVLVDVSDHGFNTDERVLSQGFNLVKLLGTREGGGHQSSPSVACCWNLDQRYKSLVQPIVTTTSQTYTGKAEHVMRGLWISEATKARPATCGTGPERLHILLRIAAKKP